MPITVIHPDGRIESRDSLTFKEAQVLVGGYVEVIRLVDGAVALVNEEGKFMRLPLNLQGTHDVSALMRQHVLVSPLLGVVIIVPQEHVESVLGSTDDEEP